MGFNPRDNQTSILLRGTELLFVATAGSRRRFGRDYQSLITADLCFKHGEGSRQWELGSNQFSKLECLICGKNQCIMKNQQWRNLDLIHRMSILRPAPKWTTSKLPAHLLSLSYETNSKKNQFPSCPQARWHNVESITVKIIWFLCYSLMRFWLNRMAKHNEAAMLQSLQVCE